MALKLINSNKLEVLIKDHLVDTIKSNPIPDPFQSEIIIVQNQGMAVYLKQKIAEYDEISCNIKFPFINGFINDTLEKFLENPPEKEYFHPYAMTWKLFQLLKIHKKKYSEISKYLVNDDNSVKRFQLASKIANVYDQYQVFRPEMINSSFINSKVAKWQIDLWEELSKDRICRSKGFDDFLNSNNLQELKEIKRISIVGIFSMPPIFISFFKKISEFIDVNFYQLQPCSQNWLVKKISEINNDEYLKSSAPQNCHSKSIEGYIEAKQIQKEKNTLLSSLGKTGREYYSLINSESDAVVINNFIHQDNNTLLGKLQNDILNNSISEKYLNSIPIFPSLQIHNCHSKMREVEVLHNNLLKVLEKNDIHPRNIIVMIPDIAEYIPYINAVFDRKDIIQKNKDSLWIPYQIADASKNYSNSIAEIFIELLQLPMTKFKANRVIDLLEIEVVHQAFGLSQDDLDLCRKWICETGISWGIDKNHREQDLGISGFDENSWKKGLDRMMLGFSMCDDINEKDRLLFDILPYDMIEGGNSRILGKLSYFMQELFRLRKELIKPKLISDWKNQLIEIIRIFFANTTETSLEITRINKEIDTLVEIISLVDLDEKIELEVIRSYFEDKLQEEFQPGRFFKGKVTFSTLQPIRNIPAKVVCLLGLGEGEFPRQDSSDSFNIMTYEQLPGDRVKRQEDQYLFLESLLSARNYLFISFIGQCVKTNDISLPSIPVIEVIEYLKTVCSSDIENKIVINHKLQAFNPLYFTDDEQKYFSYSKQDYLAHQPINTHQINGLKNEELSSENLSEISINDLVSFFTNPSKYYMKNVLGISLDKNREFTLDDSEPFELDNLENYQLDNLILNNVLNSNSKDYYEIISAQDILPVKHHGKALFDEHLSEVESFVNHIYSDPGSSLFDLVKNFSHKDVEIDVSGIKLYGRINNICGNKIVYYRYANFKGKDAVNLWLNHLIASNCQDLNNIESYCFVNKESDKKIFKLPFLEKEHAYKYLDKIIQIFLQGQLKPIPFFPATSLEYIKEKKINNKISKALKGWRGNSYINIPGEGHDEYFSTNFSEEDIINSNEFKELAETVLVPFREDEDGRVLRCHIVEVK